MRKLVRWPNGHPSERSSDPSVKICSGCGKDVYLSTATNECECGLLYNCFGQRLAPVEQWGEETGERGLDFFNGGDDE